MLESRSRQVGPVRELSSEGTLRPQSQGRTSGPQHLPSAQFLSIPLLGPFQAEAGFVCFLYLLRRETVKLFGQRCDLVKNVFMKIALGYVSEP